MVRAGQKAGQERDAVVPLSHVPEEASITAPWAPRTDGKRAVLVTPRATVFDHVVVPPIDAPEMASDPIWQHNDFRRWTPDLVHCRLLLVGEVIRRLPPVMVGGYRSQLGDLAVSVLEGERRTPPSPAEITLADWTLFELAACRWRQILLASAFGMSARKISKALAARGETVSKTAVHRHYLDDRRQLAARWQAGKQAVDRGTAERWVQIFEPAEK